MTASIPEPVILTSLGDIVNREIAILAGMQLDLFTPLKDGQLTADQIAESIGVQVDKLCPLLYALVIADLQEDYDG